MLRAQHDGITPEELIDRVGVEHAADFRDFLVHYDNYYTTHSEENRDCAELIFNRLNARGHIATRVIKQAYDPVKEMFLPDRFVKGECPRCASPDQYGDSCENCGATYAPTDLKNPVSALSGEPPVERESEHYFVRLGDFEVLLKKWVREQVPGPDGPRARVQPEIANKLDEWFEAGLQDWDISRDEPYFGFGIPDAPGKYFYVWLDAPIGYMASFKNLCARTEGLDFDEYFGPESKAEFYNFIGKDIAYFHTLFWPAMLAGADFRTPTAVNCHGFLTVDNKKMSKSRGTLIEARTYLEHLDPEYLRYYYACKLNSGIDDIDLNLDDFVQRVNSDLVGKVINIASRCAGFINRQFEGQLAERLEDEGLYESFVAASQSIASAFETLEYGRGVREIMALADKANQYIDERKPWVLIKEKGREAQVQAVCTLGLNLFRVLISYLGPILPATLARSHAFLGGPGLNWSAGKRPLLGTRINAFKPLLTRVEKDRVDAMVEATIEAAEAGAVPPLVGGELEPEINIDNFGRVDLRVAEVVHAEPVEGADKLLRLTLSLGEGHERQVFAGIKAAYEASSLVGRRVVLVANLAPRKMRFGVSEGMVLASGPGGEDIHLLSVDDGSRPGDRIK